MVTDLHSLEVWLTQFLTFKLVPTQPPGIHPNDSFKCSYQFMVPAASTLGKLISAVFLGIPPVCPYLNWFSLWLKFSDRSKKFLILSLTLFLLFVKSRVIGSNSLLLHFWGYFWLIMKFYVDSFFSSRLKIFTALSSLHNFEGDVCCNYPSFFWRQCFASSLLSHFSHYLWFWAVCDTPICACVCACVCMSMCLVKLK